MTKWEKFKLHTWKALVIIIVFETYLGFMALSAARTRISNLETDSLYDQAKEFNEQLDKMRELNDELQEKLKRLEELGYENE